MGNNLTSPHIRIGVYVCHCGSNISHMIDVEKVAKYGEKLPGVVYSTTFKYMCSDPGQELILHDIQTKGLNRIVVAACSPLLHEKTFQNVLQKAGLNPYFLQHVNIREHGSWVHTDKELATSKVMDLVSAAVMRVYHHSALEKRKVPVHRDVLIVGGGIAGIHSALLLAKAGIKVYLVEKSPTLGGHMAKLDKTFPTLDCAACILTPKISDVKNHENIQILSQSEVEKIEGYVGQFKVQVKKKSKYVIEDRCIGCLECVDACVFKKPQFPDEFNENLSMRKPVYMSFPQAVPHMVTIDPETCLEFRTGKCKKTCQSVCPKDAIDFNLQDEIVELDVGQVIIATGFQTFDAKRIPQYNYGRIPNIFTSMEIERMVNASGPTQGELKLENGSQPKSVGIIHCVGSRDENTNKWCSRVCCMYSLKLAHLIREHTQAEVYNFYIDMRCPGKGNEEFYDRVLQEGTHFIRGRVAEITDVYNNPEEKGKVICQVEDTLAGQVKRIPVDMAILAVGLEPRADAESIRKRFNISCSTGGFFLEKHPKLEPVSTPSPGIYLAGCCQGPKDIPDTVAQAGAAAAETLALINHGFVELEPNTAFILEKDCSGCKSCLPLCPYNAISFVSEKKVAEINEVLCKGCGVCVASCPSGSIHQNLFEDKQIFAEIDQLAGAHEIGI